VVKSGTNPLDKGPTSSTFSAGATVTAKPRWYSGTFPGGSCYDATHDLCAVKQIPLNMGSGPVCSVSTGDYSSISISYDVSQINVESNTYWQIVFTIGGGDGPT
jgi:hypothetical protein